MRNILKTLMLFVVVSTIAQVIGIGAASAQSQSTNVQQSTAEWSRYVTPDALSSVLLAEPQTQIIDIRSEKYAKKGTIPGATWITFSDWRGPKERPGQPPTEEALAALLGQNGLRLDQPIVIHNHSGRTIQNGRAAIVYWTLKSAGAENIAILNGGYKAWAASGLQTTSDHAAKTPTTVEVSYDRTWWADPVDIFAVASGQKHGAILDARLDGQVRKSVKTGKPLQSMPMAQYVPAGLFQRHLTAQSMSSTGQADYLADLLERGIDLQDGFLISVCQTGELSALSWFYASEILGIKNVRFYPDALQGWKSDGGLMFGLRAELQ